MKTLDVLKLQFDVEELLQEIIITIHPLYRWNLKPTKFTTLPTPRFEALEQPCHCGKFDGDLAPVADENLGLGFWYEECILVLCDLWSVDYRNWKQCASTSRVLSIFSFFCKEDPLFGWKENERLLGDEKCKIDLSKLFFQKIYAFLAIFYKIIFQKKKKELTIQMQIISFW